MHLSERPLQSTACLQFLLSEPALIKISWNPLSTNRNKAFPIQSELCSSDQSERFYLTNQDRAFWTNQTARIWSPDLHEDRPIRDQGQRLLSIWANSPWALRALFPSPEDWRVCLSCWLETMKISPQTKQRIQQPAYNGGAALSIWPGPPPHTALFS